MHGNYRYTMVFPAAHEGSLEAVSVQVSDG
jgi:hypothetical protein